MLIVISLSSTGESCMRELAVPSGNMRSPAVRGKYQDASV
jgi:hypothetical protein